MPPRHERDWPAIWQRMFGLFGLTLILVGGLWAKDLDTGAVVIIVGFFMGGNAGIKMTSNLARRSTTVRAEHATVGPNDAVAVGAGPPGDVEEESGPDLT